MQTTKPTKPAETFESVSKLSVANIKVGSPEDKTVQLSPTDSIKFKSASLSYNINRDPSNPRYIDFLLELDKVEVTYFMKKMKEKGGKQVPEWGICLNLERGKPDHMKIKEAIESIWLSIAAEVFKNKGPFGMPNFLFKDINNIKNLGMVSSGIKNPIKYQTDKVTKEVIPGGSISLWPKILNKRNEKTAFVVPDPTSKSGSKTLEWDQLKGKRFWCYPVIRFTSIYSGKANECSVQCHLVSCLIVEINNGSYSNLQNDRAAEIIKNNPELASKIMEQMKSLETADSEDGISGSSEPIKATIDSASLQNQQDFLTGKTSPTSTPTALTLSVGQTAPPLNVANGLPAIPTGSQI